MLKYKASLKIGDEDLALTEQDFDYDQGSFLDSGTTMFYSHSKVHKYFFPTSFAHNSSEIMSHFNQFCNKNPNNCQGSRLGNCFSYRGSQEDLGNFFKTFPPLSFQLENDIVFTWNPEDYLYKDGSNYCLPFNELS